MKHPKLALALAAAVALGTVLLALGDDSGTYAPLGYAQAQGSLPLRMYGGLPAGGFQPGGVGGSPADAWLGGPITGNPLLGTAVSSSGGSGYVALGNGDFVSW